MAHFQHIFTNANKLCKIFAMQGSRPYVFLQTFYLHVFSQAFCRCENLSVFTLCCMRVCAVVEGLEFTGEPLIREEVELSGNGRSDTGGDEGLAEEEKESGPSTAQLTQKPEVCLTREPASAWLPCSAQQVEQLLHFGNCYVSLIKSYMQDLRIYGIMKTQVVSFIIKCVSGEASPMSCTCLQVFLHVCSCGIKVLQRSETV